MTTRDVVDALAGLVADHGQFREIADHVQKMVDGEEGVEVVMARLLTVWDEVADPHFKEEEDIVLPAWLAADIDARQDIERIKSEHAWLREAINRLREGDIFGQERAALIGQIGWRLKDHVRWEEDEIFKRIEETLSTEQLKSLRSEVKTFRSVWRGEG